MYSIYGKVKFRGEKSDEYNLRLEAERYLVISSV